MKIVQFNSFSLVGGTALALQTGHRKSIDIDLFGNQTLEEYTFNGVLSEIGNIRILSKSKNILIYQIDGIKVDFVNYRYKWLEKPLQIDGIRLASKKDIAAMKLNAIAGRGTKKDFYDLYELLNFFTLKEMLDFYHEKYIDGSRFMVLKSLTYFDDADPEHNPELLSSLTWKEVKNRIIHEVKEVSGF